LKELPKVYFEQLLENAPDIVIAVDKQGTIIFYNDGAAQTLGYEASEVMGEHVAMLYPDSEHSHAVMDALRSDDHGGAGLVRNFETVLVDSSGHKVPVAISGSIIYDGRRRERGSIGFAKDISALIHNEQLHTLAELAVSLAHEINTPLEIVVNQSALLDRYLHDKAQEDDYKTEHERVTSINRALRRIQSIVERVGEMAASGQYGTTEYLPGRTMTDLGMREEAPSINGHAGKSRLTGRHILVVDDDEELVVSMAHLLEAEGCHVFTASSGLDALKQVGKEKIDLVLSDVVMPDMDGYDLLQELNARHSDLPVVLMTAYYYDKDHVLKRSRAVGLKDVIFKKPIDPNRLVELIDARVRA
jgi:PAS domain S-box-containing protein